MYGELLLEKRGKNGKKEKILEEGIWGGLKGGGEGECWHFAIIPSIFISIISINKMTCNVI